MRESQQRGVWDSEDNKSLTDCHLLFLLALVALLPIDELEASGATEGK